MADEEIQPAGDDERRKLVRQSLSNMNMQLTPADENVDLSRAKRIPLGQIASLGAGFAGIPGAFRTIEQTATIAGDGTLMKALDTAGNPMDIASLFTRKKGELAGTHFGSYLDGNGLHQATLVKAGPQTVTTTTTIPVDPVTLAVAVAMAEMNQKLDNIQKTVDDMFDYMKQRDKSKARANLDALSRYFNEYPQNWDSERYLSSAHVDVLKILREAKADMDFHRGQVRKKLADRAPVELRGMVESRLDGVLDSLRDCQLATYTYAFASLLDPVLSENFSCEKLESVAASIDAASVAYRELYTSCYNAIERGAKDTVDSALLDGVSHASEALGKAMKPTFVGDHTPIDEGLEDLGRAAGDFNRSENGRLLKKLRKAKSPDVAPFRESALTISSICNESSQLLTDGESLYLLSSDEK